MARTTTRPRTADEALARLVDGNARFVAGRARFPTVRKEVLAGLAKGQQPYATILGCSDSRVPPELVFDAGFGELFIVRVAGNVVSPEVLGTLQYAAVHLETPLFVVLGHEGCGAVAAALAAIRRGNRERSRIERLLQNITPGLGRLSKDLQGDALMRAAVEANVRWSMRQVLETPEAKVRTAEGVMKLVGAVFEIKTGRVTLPRYRMKTSMRLQPGTSVGPYRIVALVGAGGMGEVYRARDDRLGRDVAVKVMPAAPDAEQQARFEREARATAALSHPNIVTIFDVGTHDGQPYLVTELLDGRTLREHLASGKALDVPRAIAIALQLVRGVAAAHAVRVVHRDLKPENLFVTRDGTLKILDFGLAKLRPESRGGMDTTQFATADPDQVIGTPAYMAPEQVRGEPPDERVDIFAIGATLFEMVNGASPFRRGSVAETFAAVLHEQPSSAASRDVPAGLERVIQRCLAKDPAERFQTAADLGFALDSLAGDSGAASPVLRSAPAGASIAVLPFADMSATRDQDWLCEGLADELINMLSRIDGLRVAARSSSFQFRSSGADIQAVGAKLGVATVLEGGVRRVGDRLRVTVQLVEVASGYQRWSERFDRTVADVFAIQDEIAERVATALRGLLTPSEREALRRPETAMEAYRGTSCEAASASTSFRRRRSTRPRRCSSGRSRSIQPTRPRGRAWRTRTPGSSSGGAAARPTSKWPTAPAAGRWNSRLSSPRRTPRAGLRCRHADDMTRPRVNSTRPSVSIRTCSRRTISTAGRRLPPGGSKGPSISSSAPATCAARTFKRSA